jgi:uncharacterized protein YbaR (Trm112 family)
MNLDPSLLEILACPACRSPLRVERLPDHPQDADPEELVCSNAECRRAYPVHDDIPVLLVDDARVLSPEAHAALPGR